MDLFRQCMEPVEKTLRDAKMDKVRQALTRSLSKPQTLASERLWTPPKIAPHRHISFCVFCFT